MRGPQKSSMKKGRPKFLIEAWGKKGKQQETPNIMAQGKARQASHTIRISAIIHSNKFINPQTEPLSKFARFSLRHQRLYTCVSVWVPWRDADKTENWLYCGTYKSFSFPDYGTVLMAPCWTPIWVHGVVTTKEGTTPLYPDTSRQSTTHYVLLRLYFIPYGEFLLSLSHTRWLM